ncbi:MAG: hypothetical protein RR565_08420 [Erysipelothrix sp.]
MKNITTLLLLLCLFTSPLQIWAEEPIVDEFSATQTDDINNIKESIEYYHQFTQNDYDHYGSLIGEVQTIVTGETRDITETLYETGSFFSNVQYRYYFVLTDSGNKVVFSKNENDAMTINTIEFANENVDKFTLPVDTARLQSLIEKNNLNSQNSTYYYSSIYDSYFVYFPQSEVVIPIKQSQTPFNNILDDWEIVTFEDFSKLNKLAYDERSNSKPLNSFSYPSLVFIFAIGVVSIVIVAIFYKKEK